MDHLLETLLDITQLKLSQEKLEHLATTDSLTGIYNRRHYIESSEKEMNRAQCSRTPVSVAMIDIDHFKIVNDTYGHSVEDFVIKDLVATCQDGTRPYAVLGLIA